MTTAEQINEWAGYIALAAVIPLAVATAVYGFGAPWWRSWLGRTIFAQWASLIVVFTYILTRRFWGEYPGFEWWALGLYSALFLAFAAMAVLVIIERRAPARARSTAREGNTMSDATATPPVETPKAAFFDRAKKAVRAGEVALVGSVGATLPGFFTAVGDGTVNAGLLWSDAGIIVGAVLAAVGLVYQATNNQG